MNNLDVDLKNSNGWEETLTIGMECISIFQISKQGSLTPG